MTTSQEGPEQAVPARRGNPTTSATTPPAQLLEPMLEWLAEAAMAANKRTRSTGVRRPVCAGEWSMSAALQQDILPWLFAQPGKDAPDWQTLEERLESVGNVATNGLAHCRCEHFEHTAGRESLERFRFVDAASKLAGASWCYATAIRALQTTPADDLDGHLTLMRELRTIAEQLQEHAGRAVQAFTTAESRLLEQRTPEPLRAAPSTSDNCKRG